MLYSESKIAWERGESLENWLENSLLAISPNRDYILMSGQYPEPETFIGKLRKEPINQYIMKRLNINLDMDEQVTSLQCLPMMSTQKTAIGSIDWTVFLVGFSSGYVKFYTEQSNCLLSFKFCDEPIASIKCQTRKINPNARSEIHFATITDELLIVYKTCAILIDGLTLFENLRIAKGDVIRNGMQYEPAYNLSNIPCILTCQKWMFSEGAVISDAELLGVRLTTTFDELKADTIDSDDFQQKSCSRTLATIGSSPFLARLHESRDSTGHSYTEMIGSLFSYWNKPSPSKVQMQDVINPKVQAFFDRDRQATSIVPSPDKRLLAITDDFGRILLVDVTNWLIVRMWKGYRSAQCGWVEAKKDPDSRISPQATFLLIYAPKRGLLEVWSTQRGPRIAAINVGKGCKLLYCGFQMLNTRAAKQDSKINHETATRLVEQCYSTNCYLLNSKTETLSCIDLPYTYSLYDEGNFKSRDKLLLGELETTIQQEAQVAMISEVVHRLSLFESISYAIEMISLLVMEAEKVREIMENLINKTMRNYDNHPGELMTSDDSNIIRLAKRIIKLTNLYEDLQCKSASSNDLKLPQDLNRRLIDQYEDHPKEIDEFSQALGWTSQEVLRILSLGALERSFSSSQSINASPWPSLGEPLQWQEFIRCFDISFIDYPYCDRASKSDGRSSSSSDHDQSKSTSDNLVIRLVQFDHNFLNTDCLMKTSLFLYNHLSEVFYEKMNKVSSSNVSNLEDLEWQDWQKLMNNYNCIEPVSRLALLCQFWLSSKLSSHWKMWAFMQTQVNSISDELRVICLEQNDDDSILVNAWKLIYQLILETDNHYSALVASACLRAVTVRNMRDREQSEKLAKIDQTKGGVKDKDDDDLPRETEDTTTTPTTNELNDTSNIDWEHMCIDAERMHLVGQQLEDILKLDILLRYNPSKGHLVDEFQYSIARLSVANILRAGPTAVSELVAQWVVQSGIDLRLIKEPYGSYDHQSPRSLILRPRDGSRNNNSARLRRRNDNDNDKDDVNDNVNDENVRELIHHVRSSFPCSLEPDVILVYTLWDLCSRWASGQGGAHKLAYLSKTFECLRLIESLELSHKLSLIVYKNFFQFPFERLVGLVQSNSTLVTLKSSRIRDTLVRKELNMSEDCLEEFVKFCLHLSEFMMQSKADLQMLLSRGSSNDNKTNTTSGLVANQIAINDNHDDDDDDDADDQVKQLSRGVDHLLALDNWWQTAFNSSNSCIIQSEEINGLTNLSLCDPTICAGIEVDENGPVLSSSSLIETSLQCVDLFPLEFLVELNKLASLMDLIFRLKLIKCHPKNLIGEQSRQILQLDLRQQQQQSSSTGQSKQEKVSINHDDSMMGAIDELRRKFARKCILALVNRLNEESSELWSRQACRRELKLHEKKKNRQLSSSPINDDPIVVDNSIDKSQHGSDKRDLFTIQKSTTTKRAQKSTTIKSGMLDPTDGWSSADDEVEVNCEAGSMSDADTDTDTDLDDDDANRDIVHCEKSMDDHDDDDHGEEQQKRLATTSEAMALFSQLISLANDWQLDRDELHLELVFELYRCNHDKLAGQLMTRISDQKTLAKGLLKIVSQRLLVLAGLSPHLSGSQWRVRAQVWSIFAPNLTNWLKIIQAEEMKREIPILCFGLDSPPTQAQLGLPNYVLQILRVRTKSLLEIISGHLDGPEARLVRELQQALESSKLQGA